jgi:hypothetical protein
MVTQTRELTQAEKAAAWDRYISLKQAHDVNEREIEDRYTKRYELQRQIDNNYKVTMAQAGQRSSRALVAASKYAIVKRCPFEKFLRHSHRSILRCRGVRLGATLAGAEVKLALNHWKLAIETHNPTSPRLPMIAPIFRACDPRRYPSTDILLTSPECTNHSLAKGKKRKLKPNQKMFGTTHD